MLKLYNQKRQRTGSVASKPALQDSLLDSKISEVQSPSKSQVDSFLKQQLGRKAAGYSSITPSSYNSNNVSVTGANPKENTENRDREDGYRSNTSGLGQSNLKNEYQSNMSQISTLTAEVEENKESLAKLMRRAKQNLGLHEASKQIGDARDFKKSNDDLAHSNEGVSPSRSPRLGTRVTPFGLGGSKPEFKNPPKLESSMTVGESPLIKPARVNEQSGWRTPEHYGRPSGALTTPQTEIGFPNRKYAGKDSPQSVPTPNPTPGRPIHSSPIGDVGYGRKDALEIVPEIFGTFEGEGVSDFGFSSGGKGGLQAKPPKATPPANKMDAFRNSIDNKKDRHPKVAEIPVIPSPVKPQPDFTNFSESKASIPDGLSATSSKRSYSKRDGLESRAALMKKMKDRATRKAQKASILKQPQVQPERSQTVPPLHIDIARSNADTLGQSNYDTTSFAAIETPARAVIETPPLNLDPPTPKNRVKIDAPPTPKEQFRDTASLLSITSSKLSRVSKRDALDNKALLLKKMRNRTLKKKRRESESQLSLSNTDLNGKIF
jgi:hypothetical protein